MKGRLRGSKAQRLKDQTPEVAKFRRAKSSISCAEENLTYTRSEVLNSFVPFGFTDAPLRL
jgi:hypothetical protein